MNEHTNDHTKMGRQSRSKERKAARQTRGESKYRLELLEPRVLLSADIIAAVPVAPLATPQPTITVAEMLARPSSSFPQVASATSLPSPQKASGPSIPQPQAAQAPAAVQPLDSDSVAAKASMSVADRLTQRSLSKSETSVNLPGFQNPAQQMNSVIQQTAAAAGVSTSTDTAATETIAAPATAPSASLTEAAPLSTLPPTVTVTEISAPSSSSSPQVDSAVSLPSQPGSGSSLLQLQTGQTPSDGQPSDGGSIAVNPPNSVPNILTQPSLSNDGSSVSLLGSQDPAPAPTTPTSTVIQSTDPTAGVISPTDTATTGTIAAPVTGTSPSPNVTASLPTPQPTTTVAEVLVPSSSAVSLPSQTGSGSSLLQPQAGQSPLDGQPVDGGSIAINPLNSVPDLLTQPSLSNGGSSVSLAGSQDPAPALAPQSSTVIQPTDPTVGVISSTDTATPETISIPVTVAPLSPSLALPDTTGLLQLPAITAPISSTLLSQWQQQMVKFGQQHARELGGLTGQAAIDATYYDAARVFYQIADYTHDPSWLAAAHQAVTIYRDQYVVPINGAVPGYWNFTGGLLQDFQHTGDVRSKDAIIMLSQNASFAPDGTPLAWTAGTDASREVAYTIMNYLNAQAVGAPHNPRLDDLVTQALGHLDQWFASKTAPYLQPFMAGLTMDALIQYDTAVGGDPRILPAIQTAVTSLWANNWISGSQAFQYMDRDMGSLGGPTPANDLNMLIAPAYAWTYHKTGNVIYQQQADAIFSGAVNGAYLGDAKQFDQSFMLAFDFMNWRNG